MHLTAARAGECARWQNCVDQPTHWIKWHLRARPWLRAGDATSPCSRPGRAPATRPSRVDAASGDWPDAGRQSSSSHASRHLGTSLPARCRAHWLPCPRRRVLSLHHRYCRIRLLWRECSHTRGLHPHDAQFAISPFPSVCHVSEQLASGGTSDKCHGNQVEARHTAFYSVARRLGLMEDRAQPVLSQDAQSVTWRISGP